jgi:hypothetical protein
MVFNCNNGNKKAETIVAQRFELFPMVGNRRGFCQWQAKETN